MKTIKIGDKEVAMSRSAALPFFYRKIFKRDLLKDFSSAIEGDEDGAEIIQMLAYVMHIHTQGIDAMNSATYDTYIQWLLDFDDPWVFHAAAGDIASYYAEGAERLVDETEEKDSKKKKTSKEMKGGQ